MRMSWKALDSKGFVVFLHSLCNQERGRAMLLGPFLFTLPHAERSTLTVNLIHPAHSCTNTLVCKVTPCFRCCNQNVTQHVCTHTHTHARFKFSHKTQHLFIKAHVISSVSIYYILCLTRTSNKVLTFGDTHTRSAALRGPVPPPDFSTTQPE